MRKFLSLSLSRVLQRRAEPGRSPLRRSWDFYTGVGVGVEGIFGERRGTGGTWVCLRTWLFRAGLGLRSRVKGVLCRRCLGLLRGVVRAKWGEDLQA